MKLNKYIQISFRNKIDPSDDFTLPKLYIDWYYLKANLKRSWRGNNLFSLTVGFLDRELACRVMWNYVEREKNKEEIKRYERMKSFLSKVD